MNKLVTVYLLPLLFLNHTVKQEAPNEAIVEWRYHGDNHSSDKYSPLDQIDSSNFSELEIAWRYRSADLRLPK